MDTKIVAATDSRANVLKKKNTSNTWNEADRLAALARYRILDTPAEAAFDDLVLLAAELCTTPSAAIVFVDKDRQWVKASVNIEGGNRPRDEALCARAIACSEPLVIEDLTNEPLANGMTGFYAAAVLRTADGLPLGTLCVLDSQPRQLSERQRAHLEALGRQVMALLELRRSREANERNRQIIDSAVDYAILTTDAQGLITSWNQGAERILGWQPHAAIGSHASRFYVEEDVASGVLDKEMATAARDGSAMNERWHVRKDGSRFWASGVQMPLKDDHGQHLGFVHILRDLTERLHEQAAIRQAEERYRALVDLSPQVIWQCDADGQLIFCNSYWCDFTGLSAEASAGMGWLSAVAPDHRDAVLKQWRGALKSGQAGSFEVPLLAADGSQRWFQGSGAPVYDCDCRLLHWVLVAQDIHERRLAEIKRLESEAFTRSLLDAASEGFYSIDTKGLVTLCNEAFVKLLGFASKEDVLGRQLHPLIHHSHPDGSPYPLEECPILRTATTGEPAHVEYELFYRADGTSLPVEYRVAPLYRDRVLHGAICTFTDISERTRGEAQQSYLLELSDRLQDSGSRIELADMMADRLAQLMGAECIYQGHVDERDGLIIDQHWPQGPGNSRSASYTLGGCARTLRLRLSQGLIVPFEDLLDEADCHGNCGGLHEHLGYRSLLLAPLLEQSANCAFLLFGSRQPRRWSQADISLVREVAERIRAAADRARAREALLEAEQRVSLANEIAAIGVWEYDFEGNCLHWDAQLKALAGIAPNEPALTVDQFLARVHADDRHALLHAFRNALDGVGGGELNLEYRVYDERNDQFRWQTNRGRRLVDGGGKVRLLGTARDITAERNAALKLLRMNALLEEQIQERQIAEQRQSVLMELGDLLRGQPDSITIVTAAVRALGTTLQVTRAAFLSIDPGGQYATVERYWSDGALGDYSERMCFADYGDFIYDLQHDELVVVEDVLHDPRTAAQAASLRLRRVQSLVCVPLHEQGALSAALILLQDRPRQWAEDDISFIREVADRAWTADERMRAETALRASEEQFRTLADNMSQFAWMADPAGHIYWYNKRWYDYTGTTLEAMRALGWRSVHHPDHHERVSASMKRAVAIGSIWEETFPLRGKSGQYRWFLARAVPIRDDFGQVTRWFGTNTDITAQVTAEEALRELNDNLERRVAERTRELAEINHLLHLEMGERERAEDTLRHAQKMEAIGQLTGGLAHDFNNMLTGVLGALDLIQRRVASGQANELGRYVDAAASSANRAAALTHRLLAFARRQSLDPQPVNVNLLVESMEDMLRRTMAEHIEFDTRLQESPWLAYTDAHQLENALLNLVINARDAMSEGGRLIIQTGSVLINTPQPDGPEPGEYVTLSVADNGSGMPAEVVAKAFDPFFTTKPIGQGTGLGLSMVYGFVKQTGGHVRIDSTPGQGTLITLFLPRNRTQAAHIEEQATKPVAVSGAQADETVLVVEDEAAVRMLVVEVLQELGYQVLEAVDGNSALPHLTGTQRIDLLVSDIGLPGISGRQLAEIARQHRPDLHVLFITGYAPNAQVRGEFLGPGMDMLAKPFSIDMLGAKVRQLIERSG
ncbi:PAS domain S-box protein [Stutzerimonas zhaodongensis]|jgi:PAS domain S-box-containing protein|uniref:PAS domain S-box protein n=1 Tax=Stutzerimonas zhaodongensis TaxID=1176257 RepID=UPI001F4E075B|nr:PAS domain S-box protein [Stutzerimonas zhaodongensis]UNG18553.1 PAS domain S-box protein [Stutzerimonas zhaodongensis]